MSVSVVHQALNRETVKGQMTGSICWDPSDVTAHSRGFANWCFKLLHSL